MGFRIIDKNKFLTKKGFNSYLRKNFNGTHDKQAWECIKEYSLGDEYKGGLEEVSKLGHNRNKQKEIGPEFISTNPRDTWKNRVIQSNSLRNQMSNTMIKKFEKEPKQRMKTYSNEKNEENNNELPYTEPTLYSWFINHPANQVKPITACPRNIQTVSCKHRIRLYKKSLESHYFESGTSFVKEINNEKQIKEINKTSRKHSSQWTTEFNESISEINRKHSMERNIKTPATNKTKLKYGLL